MRLLEVITEDQLERAIRQYIAEAEDLGKRRSGNRSKAKCRLLERQKAVPSERARETYCWFGTWHVRNGVTKTPGLANMRRATEQLPLGCGIARRESLINESRSERPECASLSSAIAASVLVVREGVLGSPQGEPSGAGRKIRRGT